MENVLAQQYMTNAFLIWFVLLLVSVIYGYLIFDTYGDERFVSALLPAIGMISLPTFLYGGYVVLKIYQARSETKRQELQNRHHSSRMIVIDNPVVKKQHGDSSLFPTSFVSIGYSCRQHTRNQGKMPETFYRSNIELKDSISKSKSHTKNRVVHIICIVLVHFFIVVVKYRKYGEKNLLIVPNLLDFELCVGSLFLVIPLLFCFCFIDFLSVLNNNTSTNLCVFSLTRRKKMYSLSIP
jgi:hypothetical protein